MPQYDHTCKKCKHDFVVEMRMSEVGEKGSQMPQVQEVEGRGAQRDQYVVPKRKHQPLRVG